MCCNRKMTNSRVVKMTVLSIRPHHIDYFSETAHHVMYYNVHIIMSFHIVFVSHD